MDDCPRCGKGMTDGFLGAKSGRDGLQWYGTFAGQNFFGIRGESIGENDRRMGWLSASRCPECRLILARY